MVYQWIACVVLQIAGAVAFSMSGVAVREAQDEDSGMRSAAKLAVIAGRYPARGRGGGEAVSRFPANDVEDAEPREVCVAVLGYPDDIERVRVFSNEALASLATGVIGRNTGYGWHLFPADFEESVRVEVTSEISSGADK